MSDQPKWIRCTKAKPCPRCEKGGWCSVSEDGELCICMRVSEGCIKPTRNEGYLHKLTDSPPPKRTNYNRPQPKDYTPTFDALKVSKRSFESITDERTNRLADSLGVSVWSLFQLRAGWSGQFQAYTFPMRDHEGKVIGIRLRGEDGSKWAVRGSKSGLFIPQPIQFNRGGLMICEGPTDCAACLDMGFNAVGRPDCLGGAELIERLVRKHGIKNVCIVHDRDEEGSKGGEHTIRGAASLLDKLRALPSADCIKVLSPPSVKDVRQWMNKGGYEDTRKAIRACIKMRKPRFNRLHDEISRSIGMPVEQVQL